jgi:hypothetical protein
MAEIRIKAFRAINNQQDCERFIEGHKKVLDNIGVNKVSSLNTDWMYNPAVFVILAESMDGSKAFGGARVHLYGGTQPLPIIDAIKDMDPRVIPLLDKYKDSGTGEFCGLWNSREVAGMGIGSIFLIRSGVVITSQLKIKSLFALCASYTVQMAEKAGFVKDTSIGINGAFYYPKIDFVAQVMILKDLYNIHAEKENKSRIISLRTNPNSSFKETLRGKELILNYHLKIDNLKDFNYRNLF